MADQQASYPLQDMRAAPPRNEAYDVTLESLRYLRQTVECPACHHLGKSAIPDRTDGTGQAWGKTATVVSLTLCTTLPCLCCIYQQYHEDEPRHATHYCERCGLRLAFWYGDDVENIICTKNGVLTTITAAQDGSGVPLRGAWSPWGMPPPFGSNLYANVSPIEPDPSMLRRVLHVTGITIGLFTEVRHSQSGVPFLRIPGPQLESAEYSVGWVFLPQPIRNDPKRSRAYNGGVTSRTRTGEVIVYRCDNNNSSRSRDQTGTDAISNHNAGTASSLTDIAAMLTFYLGYWRVEFRHHHPVGQHTVNQAMATNPIFGNEGDMFFPFKTDLGPLTWVWRDDARTRRTEQRRLRSEDKKEAWQQGIVAAVLVDAYNRVVATASAAAEMDASPAQTKKTKKKGGFGPGDVVLSLYALTEEVSDAFVEQVAISYLVVAIQTRREKDWLHARHLEWLERQS